MTLHLIKLSVGSESLDDLKAWQKDWLKMQKAQGIKKPELVHVTRQMPKRADELLDGGSIYWVVKGWIVARQKILDLREVEKNGLPHCAIVYDKTVTPVQMRQQRAFQGWRYLAGKDAPKDSNASGDDLPDSLKKELAELGLL
jgi:hypothetical protein